MLLQKCPWSALSQRVQVNQARATAVQAVPGYRWGSVPDGVTTTENRRYPKIGNNSTDPRLAAPITGDQRRR